MLKSAIIKVKEKVLEVGGGEVHFQREGSGGGEREKFFLPPPSNGFDYFVNPILLIPIL